MAASSTSGRDSKRFGVGKGLKVLGGSVWKKLLTDYFSASVQMEIVHLPWGI